MSDRFIALPRHGNSGRPELLQQFFRCDRGSQYLSIRYTERLKDAGIQGSVGSVGNSYDNALAETINGLYKAEVIYHDGPWRGLIDVEFATLKWVHWFNNNRLFEKLGYIPPAEFEENFYNRHASQKLAA